MKSIKAKKKPSPRTNQNEKIMVIPENLPGQGTLMMTRHEYEQVIVHYLWRQLRRISRGAK